MSPDGKQVLLDYSPDALPKNWKEGGFYRSVVAVGGGTPRTVTVLCDLASRRSSIPFEGYVSGPSRWSDDGKSFVIQAHAPAGTKWDQEDIGNHRTAGLDSSLFWVQPDSARVERVVSYGLGRVVYLAIRW